MSTAMRLVYENIDACRVCGKPELVEILAFGDMPLANALRSADELAKAELVIPLTVVFCPACSLVQIRETVDPEILFASDYPFFSSISDEWVAHARRNALELIETRQLGPGSLVVEIGSNDAYLLRNYAAAGIPVLGIDPASGPSAAARALGIPVREEFFGRTLAEALVAEGRRADVIHANNVFAHVADLAGVVEGMRLLLAEHGVAVIEVPYVRDLVDGCQFDTIYHEHLCYFSVTAVSRLFARYGLTLVDVRRLPTYGGSLRLYVQRSGAASPAVETLLAEEEATGLLEARYYRDFGARVRTIQTALRDLLRSLKARGKRIAGYAVSAKATILLNSSGIDGGLVDYLVDRNPHKQGLYVPGVHLPVYPPTKLLDPPIPDYLLLLAWNFKDEIIAQQRAYQTRGGRFVVPVPVPEIL